MKFLVGLALIMGITSGAVNPADPPGAGLQPITRYERGGTAVAVRAPDAPLVYTRQIVAEELGADAGRQTEQALNVLQRVLLKAGSDVAHVVRLNVYISDQASGSAVRTVIAARFRVAYPASTFVHTALASPGALVALDAVAVTTASPGKVDVSADFAILPEGAKAFISGQAETGETLSASVQRTMDSLQGSLAHLGLQKSDIVQIKAFITPFAEHALAKAAVQASFGDQQVPPIVLMEWRGEVPAEIELVASARTMRVGGGEALSFPSLPGLANSPRFSRVAVVKAGTPLIFLSSIEDSGQAPARAWRLIFAELEGILAAAQGSFRQLVKATYYFSDPNARQPLGDIRGVYYDPKRPPAASALLLADPKYGRSLTALDMIAVPAGR